MSEIFENSKRIVTFLKDNPWLFTDSPYLSVEQYIKYFEYGKDSEFHIFPAMLPYKINILEKFKNKVYNTTFLPTGPSTLGMHTIVQINRNLHVVFIWGNSSDNREVILYATLHVENPNDYVKFLAEHEDLVYNDEKPGGFFVPQNQ